MLEADLYPSGVGTGGVLLVRSHNNLRGLENNQTSDIEALILTKAYSRPGGAHTRSGHIVRPDDFSVINPAVAAIPGLINPDHGTPVVQCHMIRTGRETLIFG